MNTVNSVKTPFFMTREDFVRGEFFLEIDKHFAWRSFRGMKTDDLCFSFLLERPINPTEMESLVRVINFFEDQGERYWCRMDLPKGSYWFYMKMTVDVGIQRGWVVYDGAGTEEKQEEVVIGAQDMSPLLFVEDNCYNPEKDDSPYTAPPLGKGEKIRVVFNKDIFPVNFQNIRVFRGTKSVNHEITETGDTRPSTFEVLTKVKVQKNVLEISPRYGEFEQGDYFYAIGPDALRDTSGNMFEGRNNMFNI